MSQGGFFEQKRASPASLALVVALHVVVLGAVALVKGPVFTPAFFPPTKVTFVPLPEDPPVVPPEPVPLPESRVTAPQTEVDRLPQRPENPVREVPRDPVGPVGPVGGGGGTTVPDPPAHVPVRRDAELDPRYAALLRPPYPASEQRAQRGGVVRIRVTIGTDGRVRAVERVSATSDAFWAAAERQALSRWRFRPATLDGRPVESSKVLTLHFRIEDA